VSDIPIQLIVEDVLSEEVLRKILLESGKPYQVGDVYGMSGFGYIKSRIDSFNQAARTMPYLVLTDLDRAECPPTLIAEWLGHPIHHNMLFRVAVTEVETWIMADRKAFARFLGIAQNLVLQFPEKLQDPKEKLISLARKSPKALIKKAIVPEAGLTVTIGPGYNEALSSFVRKQWKPSRAKPHSKSLERALNAVENFKPVFDS
jgi:hypothetical protein